MTMKLSEAIRLGAMWKPQAFTGPRGIIPEQTHTCALAAAAEAIGQRNLNVLNDDCWPWQWANHMTLRPCPACGLVRANEMWLSILNITTHLNDKHRWTREEIADWVETIEPSEIEITATPAVTEKVSA